jgi:mRNA interferase MazF
MQPIDITQLDKAGPILLLTRGLVRPHLATATVAPINQSSRRHSPMAALTRGLRVLIPLVLDNKSES